MSFEIFTRSGFGIDSAEVTNAAISDDKRIAFVEKYLPSVFTADMSIEDKVYAIETYEDDCGEFGFAALFADAISKSEGIDVQYFAGEYSGAIMFEARLPWEMSRKAFAMTADDFSEMFQKYLAELGATAVAEYKTVEFCC